VEKEGGWHLAHVRSSTVVAPMASSAKHAAAAESSSCCYVNAVGLTSVLDRGQLIIIIICTLSFTMSVKIV